MKNPLLEPELRELLQQGNTAALGEVINEMQPASTAEFLSALQPEEIWSVLRPLPMKQRVDIFVNLDLEIQAELASGQGKREMAKLVEEMPPDDRADLVQKLDDNVRDGILPLVAAAERADIRKLVSYPEDTAGSVMTTDYAALPAGLTVAQALEQLRKVAPDAENIFTIYIINPQRRLVGVVTLEELVLARPTKLVDHIMVSEDIAFARVDEDQEEVASRFAQYDLLSMPVVDAADTLVGIITVDDVVDVIEEEAEEDIYRLGAAGEPVDYWRSSPLHIARQRVVWLLILVVAGLGTAFVMKGYERIIHVKAFAILALFVPLVAGSSGNAGSQTGTTVVRGLGTGEIKVGDFLKLVAKELITGAMVGTIVATLGMTAGLILGGWRLALSVGVAQLVAIMMAKTFGAVFPVLFKRLGFDPALMSTPLIATFNDIGSISLYLALGYLIMGRAG